MKSAVFFPVIVETIGIAAARLTRHGMKVLVSFLLLLCLCASCGTPARQDADPPLFTLLPSSETGVTFQNEIVEQEGFNVLEYEYFYNGGGVAVGDVNGDGLPDLYLSANMRPDRLYINKGGLRFEDVTEQAGLSSEPSWTTGVTMVDIDDDGWLDIYVCRSGRVGTARRRNALYVNDGSGTFTDRAADYGLDDPSYSNHASFFDADRDGDLDLFLLNHSIRRLSRFDVAYMRSQRDSLAGDKFYRNEGGTFVDVSEEAGIIGNPLGFGLGAVVSDIDKDGWLDLYVANDYVEDDYLYLNDGDGTFTESIRAHLTHTSYSSMGLDVADINNDALPDVVTLDMLAEDQFRQKVLKGPEDFVFYQDFRRKGYHEQYMRNMLHLNDGDGSFSEIGQFAGVSNTDWSWAPLLADFDLDGDHDLLVTNGYVRDYTNLDFLNGTLVEAHRQASARGEALSSMEMVRQMPVTPLENYIYENASDLTFDDRTQAWGLDQPSLSNGAAYTDLDGDGDLDIVINNINQEAFIYRNDAERTTSNHFLTIDLEGPEGNRLGIGTKVEVTGEGGRRFYREMILGRGYLSSVEPRLFFGLGDLEHVDVEVVWPDQTRSRLGNVPVDRMITVRHRRATGGEGTAVDIPSEAPPHPLFTRIADGRGLRFSHEENPFVDFEREPLLPHMLSRQGPALAHGDIDGDGLEDVFVGGARGQAGALFVQRSDGSFGRVLLAAFEAHRAYEDTDALFADLDADGDEDLYVVSGGAFEAQDLSAYQDRVYVNDGWGMFAHDARALPDMPSSGASVAAHDFDADGDVDLFVGGRVLPGRYPLAPRSYLLENTGGRFADVTAAASEELLAPGMVTDALWRDLDGDGSAELILVGEWMPIRVFRYGYGHRMWNDVSVSLGFEDTGGWWNDVLAGDLDGDGDLDLIAGNRGLNAQMRATPAEPAAVYAADLNGDGRDVFVLGSYIQGQRVPVPWRDELLEQVPGLARSFPTYASYASATLDDLFSGVPSEAIRKLEAHVFASSLFENVGDGVFRMRDLPAEAQFAPVHAMLLEDVNEDGLPDLLLAGNMPEARAQWGRYHAGRGLLLLNRGDLTFERVPAARSGFGTSGAVRAMARVPTPSGSLVVVARNHAETAVFMPSALSEVPDDLSEGPSGSSGRLGWFTEDAR